MEFLSQVIHNTTVPAHLVEASASSPLYSSIDFASLNVFEQLWGPSRPRSLLLWSAALSLAQRLTSSCSTRSTARWYMWVGNPVLATGIVSFVLHEVRPNCEWESERVATARSLPKASVLVPLSSSACH